MKSGWFAAVSFCALAGLINWSCQRVDRGSAEQSQDRVVLPAGEVHQGWYFAAGKEVYLNGTVNGDAYVAGGIVNVTGTINGDLLVAGGEVTVTGTVTDDIRAAGGVVRIGGTTGKYVTAAGGTVSVDRAADIGQGLLAAGSNVFVGGHVGHDARLAGSVINVSGRIEGSVDASGKDISVLQGSRIGGDLNAWVDSPKDVEVGEGAVAGKTNIHIVAGRPERAVFGYSPWYFWLKIFWAASLLIVGLVFTLLFPRQFASIGESIIQLPGMSVLWGIIGLVVIPFVCLLLFMTGIGIPLGMFLCMAYLWIIYLSQLSFGVVLGLVMLRNRPRKGWILFGMFAAGLVIVQALTFIPYVRAVAVVGGLVFGAGAILRVIWFSFQAYRTAQQAPTAVQPGQA